MTQSGIESVAADADATPVYYNLQGVRMDSKNLTPGVYIRVKANKAEKINIRL